MPLETTPFNAGEKCAAVMKTTGVMMVRPDTVALELILEGGTLLYLPVRYDAVRALKWIVSRMPEAPKHSD
jgi:hypothetical protein